MVFWQVCCSGGETDWHRAGTHARALTLTLALALSSALSLSLSRAKSLCFYSVGGDLTNPI